MKLRLLILLAAVTVTAFVTYAVTRYRFDRPRLASNVVTGSMHSGVLGEEREYLVHLPASYQRALTRRYPVLYVLDGSSQDLHTAASAELLARIGVMPEVLVVGIPNVSGAGRQRDYTPPGMRQDIDEPDSPEGQADRFLSFLKAELIPRIERDYRADGRRMLAGNSRGALLVVYSLLAAPALFEARFAHSPALWRDDEAIVARLETGLPAPPPLAGYLFLSLGDGENAKMTAAFTRTVALLEAAAPPSLRWHAELTPGAVHGTNAELATPVGLRLYFAGAPELPAR